MSAPLKLLCEVAEMLQPICCDPPPQHWLDSDATYSYCYSCARKARWAEMDIVGPPSPPQNWFDRSEIEEQLVEGIDGGEWYSGESDTPQNCHGCGCTLRFHLTKYGVEYTLEGFEADSIHPSNLDNPDCMYELREMLDAGAWCDDPRLLADLTATATVVRDLMAMRAPAFIATSGGSHEG